MASRFESCDRLGELSDAVGNAARPQRNDAAADLGHDLAQERNAVGSADAFRLLGSAQQLFGLAEVVEKLRAEGQRKSQIERVVTAPGVLVFFIARRTRLVGLTQHPEVWAALDSFACQQIGGAELS